MPPREFGRWEVEFIAGGGGENQEADEEPKLRIVGDPRAKMTTFEDTVRPCSLFCTDTVI